MSPLPSLKGSEIVAALERSGYSLARIKGSHWMLQKEGRTVPVPVHQGDDVPKPTLRAILRLAGLSEDEFLTLLRS